VPDHADQEHILKLLRSAVGPAECWIVGGAVRDRLRGGVEVTDFDLVVAGDVRDAARRLARAGHGTAFALSGEFGAWRVVARPGSWRADISPLHGERIEDDLGQRDFTVNAMAEPLAGGDLLDPLGGAHDLELGRLRLAARGSLERDPLRAMRLVRLACELDLQPDAPAIEAARHVAPRLADVAAERVYGELQRILASERAPDGIRLLGEVGLTAVVLPELDALGGIGQSPYHHLDVFDAATAVAVRALLDEPLADDMSRGLAMRFAALMHDIAKPATRTVAPDGRVGFPSHDALGAQLARAILARLRAAATVQSYVAELTRHHLRLGFLVHRRPLSRAELYGYLDACGGVAADVTLLSVADRLATRGAHARESIDAHLELSREVIGEALRWHAEGHPRPPLRGDELAAALGIEAGPLLGELLAALTEAQFTGAVATHADAVAFARSRMA
jgi:putative nucleotidyltransferase with HDIG domain